MDTSLPVFYAHTFFCTGIVDRFEYDWLSFDKGSLIYGTFI